MSVAATPPFPTLSPQGGEGFARKLAVLVAAVVALLWTGAALAAPTFPPLTGRVVDNAHVLSAQTAQKLDGELANLEAQTGHQLVVATIPDLQGYDIADYGYQLGRYWQIGRKGQNDGAVFIVAPNERKVRIEVGYGLEPVLTDALSSVILQQKVLPRFRDGQMEQGVVDGTEAIIQQLALPDDQAKQNVAQAEQVRQQQAEGGGGGVSVGLIISIVVIFWVLGSLLRGFGGGGFSGGGGSFGGGGSSGSW
jgi:uncharacterized protein